MAKKKQNNIKEYQFSDNSSIKDTIKLIIVIIVVLVLFYLLTVFILNKKSNNITTNSSIQYTKILAGESFNQKENDYLVFFYDQTLTEASTYADLVSSYRDKEKHLTIYTVDLNEGMNKNYLSRDEENSKATQANELKIKGPTIIRFKDNQITDYITSSFDNYLNNNVE